MQDKFIITDLETLKVISHPLRLEILNSLGQSRVVKEISEQVDVPATKLYYHINLLEKHGIIQVVDTQIVSGIIEKSYQATAHYYHVSDDLFKGEEPSGEYLNELLDSIFDVTRREVMQSVEQGLLQLSQQGNTDELVTSHLAILSRCTLDLTSEQALDLQERLNSLMEEFETLSAAQDTETKSYGLTVMYYPLK